MHCYKLYESRVIFPKELPSFYFCRITELLFYSFFNRIEVSKHVYDTRRREMWDGRSESP